jgi:pimeloyl-ACP methyl ester carboxylesterase
MTEAIQKKIKFDYARVGGIKLHYAMAGTGEKLVILLHGFPEFWYAWRHQLVDLSDEYTVVAPDLRGFNLSDKPKQVSDYEIDNLVDDITGLIRYFKRDKAVVAGHDWGAGVAWAIATKNPEYVEKLVCLQVPPVPVWKKNQTLKQFFASWYMFFFQIPRIPEWLLSRNDFEKLVIGLKTSTAEKGVFTDADIDAYKKAWGEPDALRCSINYYRANIIKRMFGSQTQTNKINVPTLFIYGEKDHAVLPETVENVGDFIDSEYKELRIPNSGHWVQIEASDAVTGALREFIAN